jgi:hypothetical protein
MVIFGLFVKFFVLFISRRSSWFLFCSFSAKWVFLKWLFDVFCSFSAKWVFSSIGGVGILAGSRRRVGRRSGVDLAGYTGPFSVYRPFLRIPYIVYNIRKKKEMKKKRTDRYLFFSCIFFFFKKKKKS